MFSRSSTLPPPLLECGPIPILHDLSLEGRLIALLEEVETQAAMNMLNQHPAILDLAQQCRQLATERTKETLDQHQIEPHSPLPARGHPVDTSTWTDGARSIYERDFS